MNSFVSKKPKGFFWKTYFFVVASIYSFNLIFKYFFIEDVSGFIIHSFSTLVILYILFGFFSWVFDKKFFFLVKSSILYKLITVFFIIVFPIWFVSLAVALVNGVEDELKTSLNILMAMAIALIPTLFAMFSLSFRSNLLKKD